MPASLCPQTERQRETEPVAGGQTAVSETPWTNGADEGSGPASLPSPGWAGGWPPLPLLLSLCPSSQLSGPTNTNILQCEAGGSSEAGAHSPSSDPPEMFTLGAEGERGKGDVAIRSLHARQPSRQSAERLGGAEAEAGQRDMEPALSADLTQASLSYDGRWQPGHVLGRKRT